MLNILEIGAGTGGTTGYVLPELTAGRANYVFSDISSFFLEKIKKKFSKYPFLSYQLLDIERNPTSKAFCRIVLIS